MESARIKAFLESADRGSFKAAADELGYTPSGVSQLVAALEKELGLKLLDRSSKGVKASSEGKLLLPLARNYISQERDIMSLASEIKGVTTGNITIASYQSVAVTWLPEVVRHYKNDFPNVQIQILECVRPEIFDVLDNHEADMSFLTLTEQMAKDSSYEWIPLADREVIAVVPEDHPMASMKAYPIGACESDDFIMSPHDTEIREILQRYDVHPQVKYTTNDTPATLAMVRMGLGVSFVNDLSAERWNEELVKLPLYPEEKITFGIAYPSLDRMSIAAKKFLRYAVSLLTQAYGEEAKQD